ncbi:hypothetical protein [Nocardioides sp.]|uniref:hypothetical protein n=1 Tax=Nocardioides sp. TaxID=35761 RepID=UPI0031FEA56A|nr:hypothetical protein [Nocardioides sp.]
MQLFAQVLPLLIRVVDQSPADADVKAGWPAFGLFMLLVAAVVFLGFSLSKQLRKAAAAKDAGVYDDPDEPESHPTS